MRYTRQIREFVKNKPKFTNKQLYAEFPHLTHKQISMALFNMKKDNMVRLLTRGKWENLTLTPVNKARVATRTYTNTKSKEIADLKVKLEQANHDILYWNKLAKKAEEMQAHINLVEHDLDEALVLIRYLENKLFIAIQHDARTNGNT